MSFECVAINTNSKKIQCYPRFFVISVPRPYECNNRSENMHALRKLSLNYFDHLLVSYNNELTSLQSTSGQSYSSVEDKFYSSIDTHDPDTVDVMSLIKQSNDFIFDKACVNPFFAEQSSTVTLMTTVESEKEIHTRYEETDTEEETFVEAKRKMSTYVLTQRSRQEQELKKRYKATVLHHRWLYQPKMISPFVKDFLHDCFITEHISATFQKTLSETGTRVDSSSMGRTDCIYAYPLENCIDDKEVELIFNRLALPAVYRFPKRLNTVYMFNKYLEQFHSCDSAIAEGENTLRSVIYNIVKMRNIDKSQTVANFIDKCRQQKYSDDADVARFEKLQHFSILCAVLRKKLPNLKVKRAERGKISMYSGEFLFRTNTMYFFERKQLWGIYVGKQEKPIYSDNLSNLLERLIVRA